MIGISPIMEIQKDQSILSESEKKELSTINFEARVNSWWKAREILSKISRHFGVDYKGLRKGDNGKPHFIKGTDFHCSLSHSVSHVAAMISSISCGIDVERIDPKVERVFQKFSSESELGSRTDLKYKTAIWACKESIYKAVDTPGILFRDQIRLCEWKNEDSQVDFDFLKDKRATSRFSCEIRWFEDQVLAYTLEKNT